MLLKSEMSYTYLMFSHYVTCAGNKTVMEVT